jgi:hypothetical protein
MPLRTRRRAGRRASAFALPKRAVAATAAPDGWRAGAMQNTVRSPQEVGLRDCELGVSERTLGMKFCELHQRRDNLVGALLGLSWTIGRFEEVANVEGGPARRMLLGPLFIFPEVHRHQYTSGQCVDPVSVDLALSGCLGVVTHLDPTAEQPVSRQTHVSPERQLRLKGGAAVRFDADSIDTVAAGRLPKPIVAVALIDHEQRLSRRSPMVK